ncbi:MAG TPA: chorismate mutase [Limnochordales bacterium]
MRGSAGQPQPDGAPPLRLRGIRGAVCVGENTPRAIEQAARRLVEAIAQANDLAPHQVVSAIFTVTADLDAQFPAVGARQAGWQEVPLLCAQEVPVPGSLPRCIRVLVHAYLPEGQGVRHVYLDGAEVLRPDWSGPADSMQSLARG